VPIPTEFRYEDRRHTPVARLIRGVGRVFFGFDPAPREDLLRAFGEAYFEGDPIAEDFVRAELPAGGLHGAHKKLDRAFATESFQVGARDEQSPSANTRYPAGRSSRVVTGRSETVAGSTRRWARSRHRRALHAVGLSIAALAADEAATDVAVDARDVGLLWVTPREATGWRILARGRLRWLGRDARRRSRARRDRLLFGERRACEELLVADA
jgi:hypothetical protein